MTKRNWHMRAIHLVVALAFLLGLAIAPGLVTAQMTAPTLDPPNIDFNVKSAIHKVCIDWNGDDPGYGDMPARAVIDWWLEAGVMLDPESITVIEPSGINPHVGGNRSYDETIKRRGYIDNVGCIEIRSMHEGDIHIFVEITVGAESWELHTEKKWGELHRTELDVYADTPALDHTHSEEFCSDETEEYDEILKDTVYAWFPTYGEELADGAIVHWWLVEDTDDNQDWVDDFMDYLAANNGSLTDDHWAARGKYKASELGGRQPWEYINDWVCGPDEIAGTADDRAVDPNLFYFTDVNVPGDVNNTTNTLDWYAWAETDNGIATATLSVNLDDEEGLEPCTTYKVMIVVLVWYPSATSPQDDPHNGENRICLEKGKKTFHKGLTPEIDQVKTPQLRWAGEKLVLEKDWGEHPYFEPGCIYEDTGGKLHYEPLDCHDNCDNQSQDPKYADWYLVGDYFDARLYMAIYSLEEGSVGNLEPINDLGYIDVYTEEENYVRVYLDSIGLPRGAQQVIAPLGGGLYHPFDGKDEPDLWWHSVSQAIVCTEMSGQVDVNAALYEVGLRFENRPGETSYHVDEIWFEGPVQNHGFLAYFLEFEEVVLADMDEGALIDITTWDSLTGLTPEQQDGNVTVQVRGFFDYRHSHLPATLRLEQPIDYDGDGTMDVMLPEGRYVLPDDWWLLAGTKNIDLRPNFDLMDAHNDTIVSELDTNLDYDEELGPYNSEVRTTDPPKKAEYPTIGPFSTLQLWSTEDMWITSATVPSSFPLPDGGERNTVVPDGNIDWYDAPMPQALVIFEIDPAKSHTDAALSELDKGDLEGYGFQWSGDDKVYQSPYYRVEIPASPFIPPGYNWDSWGGYGPYDFWTDLKLESIISNIREDPIDPMDVEVYSDNHGIAGVTVDALDTMGIVTITATAEYPYGPKRGKYGPRVSDDIPVIWGPPIVHLDADFEADPRDGDAPLTVTFDPAVWTIGGTPPYVKLVWDFGDGTPTQERTGSWDLSADLPTITHTYTEDGIYTVSLEVTDSTVSPIGPMVDICEKIAYITVGAAEPCDPTPSPELAFADLITEGKLVIVYNFDPFTTDPTAVNGWTWYDPTLPASENNLGDLQENTAYWVKATEECWLTYGNWNQPHLAAGWNNPVWLAC